jgi:hypothetical protein
MPERSGLLRGDVTFLHLSRRFEAPTRLPEEECKCDREEAHYETRNSKKISERMTISRLEAACRKRRAAKIFIAGDDRH